MGLGTAALGILLGGAGTAFSSMASKKGGEEAQNAADKAADRLMDLARETGIPLGDLLFAFSNPNAGNAPLAGASLGALEQLGAPVGSAVAAGSPSGSIVNAAGSGSLSFDQFNLAQRAVGVVDSFVRRLAAEDGTVDPAKVRRAVIDHHPRGEEMWNLYARSARLAGFASPVEAITAQSQFDVQARQIQQEQAEVAPDVRAGRLAALRGVADLQRDFPIATASNIRDLEQRQIASRLRDLERNREEQIAQIAQQANVLRFNPGGAFGEVEEEFADQRFQLENTDALVRALTILEGQTSLGASGLSALQGSLNAPIGNALAAGQLQSQGQQASGSLAARQAQVLNQLRVSQEQFESGLRQNAIATRFGGDLADIRGKVEAAQNAADFTSQTGGMLMGGGFGGGGGMGGGAGGFGGGGGSNAPATGGSLLRSLGG